MLLCICRISCAQIPASVKFTKLLIGEYGSVLEKTKLAPHDSDAEDIDDDEDIEAGEDGENDEVDYL